MEDHTLDEIKDYALLLDFPAQTNCWKINSYFLVMGVIWTNTSTYAMTEVQPLFEQHKVMRMVLGDLCLVFRKVIFLIKYLFHWFILSLQKHIEYLFWFI